jgi:UDP-N-acetyl-D-glucosamine dehydrogenase
MRESPALDIMRLLENRGAKVSYHDPFVPEFEENGHRACSVPLTPQALAAADLVVIVTDHSTVDYDMVRANAKVVVDTRNALKRTRTT